MIPVLFSSIILLLSLLNYVFDLTWSGIEPHTPAVHADAF